MLGVCFAPSGGDAGVHWAGRAARASLLHHGDHSTSPCQLDRARPGPGLTATSHGCDALSQNAQELVAVDLVVMLVLVVKEKEEEEGEQAQEQDGAEVAQLIDHSTPQARERCC